ncbi:MAG TPA: glycosyltransferase, partial [Armatimonadota bacterium]|nr:glycosyltransferase [Armatimonadota bacterium]
MLSPSADLAGSPAAAVTRTNEAGRPLTIVHLLRSLETGGQELMCARLVERLDRSRFRPVLLSLQGSGWLEERLRGAGVPVHCLHAREGFRPGAILRLALLLRRLEADVLHCHNRKALLYGGLAAALCPGSRVVFTKHGASFWHGQVLSGVGRWITRRAAAVVAVSRDIAGPLESHGWTRPGGLRTILNGVDTEEFRPGGDARAARCAAGLPPDGPVIGTVARLSPEKDQLTLLRAFRVVRERVPGARLLLVGDGPLRSELESAAAELGVAAEVRFAGERTDIPRMLAAM